MKYFYTFIAFILFSASLVAGNGQMNFPHPRLPSGDFQTALALLGSPTTNYGCGNAPTPGRVTTKYVSGQSIKVVWEITEALEGQCFMDLSTTGKDTDFQQIGTLPNCADQVGDSFTANVKLPDNVTCDNCIMRFRWIPALSGETYLNCADVSIEDPKPKSLKMQKRRQRKRQCGGCHKE